MHRQRTDGSRAVLLVVDAQAGVVKDAWDAERIVRNIAAAVAKARAQGAPVIWVQHTDEDLPAGSPEWQWASGLAPSDGETRIEKQFNSSFEGTPLEEALARLGASRIVLAGAATNWCIRATAYAALERGYDLTLLADAHTTETMDFEDGAVIRAEDLIRELNLAMTWLSYPGRKNEAVPVADVDFCTPDGAG